jgi:hypothetical protein
MYVVNKDKQFCMFNEHKDEDGRIISTTKTDTARMILINEFDADTLVDQGDVSDFDWIVVGRMV